MDLPSIFSLNFLILNLNCFISKEHFHWLGIGMEFTEAKMGRIFVVRLHDSDRLPEVLENFAISQQIASALAFFIGGAKDRSKVVVGPKDGNVLPPEPLSLLLEGVHEACGIGTIVQNEEGKPKLHMHAAFGRKKETITGCVRLGVDIWQIGEVVILELLGAFAMRAKDSKTGFEFLEIK
jgi:uncharacterized protein